MDVSRYLLPFFETQIEYKGRRNKRISVRRISKALASVANRAREPGRQGQDKAAVEWVTGLFDSLGWVHKVHAICKHAVLNL